MLSVYQCGKCGSPAVDSSEIANSANCRACGWSGKMDDLIVTVGNSSGPNNVDQLAKRFFLLLRDLIAKHCALPIGRFLIENGFVEASDKQGLERYLRVVTMAMANAVIKEREVIEKEKIRAQG